MGNPPVVASQFVSKRKNSESTQTAAAKLKKRKVAEAAEAAKKKKSQKAQKNPGAKDQQKAPPPQRQTPQQTPPPPPQPLQPQVQLQQQSSLSLATTAQDAGDPEGLKKMAVAAIKLAMYQIFKGTDEQIQEVRDVLLSFGSFNFEGNTILQMNQSANSGIKNFVLLKAALACADVLTELVKCLRDEETNSLLLTATPKMDELVTISSL